MSERVSLSEDVTSCLQTIEQTVTLLRADKLSPSAFVGQVEEFLLHHPHWRVRMVAACALAEGALPESVPVLCAALRQAWNLDEEQRLGFKATVAYYLLEALRRIDDPAAVETVEEFVERAPPDCVERSMAQELAATWRIALRGGRKRGFIQEMSKPAEETVVDSPLHRSPLPQPNGVPEQVGRRFYQNLLAASDAGAQKMEWSASQCRRLDEQGQLISTGPGHFTPHLDMTCMECILEEDQRVRKYVKRWWREEREKEGTVLAIEFTEDF